MQGKFVVLVAILPVAAVAYFPSTEYIEDHCSPSASYSFSKDFLLRFSDTRSYIPGRPYSCPMTVRNRAPSRQVQLRVIILDTLRKPDCSSGAVIIREGSKFLTPQYGICGSSAPSTRYRSVGNSLTVEVTNNAKNPVYGDFKLLLTAIYNATSNTSSSCYGDDFQCQNGLCISSQLICNGYDDCGDDSDEEEGCALAAGVIVGIVIAVLFCVGIISAVGCIFGHRRRRYSRVTQVVREYPSIRRPVAGSYVPSYSGTTAVGAYQSL